MRGLGWRFATAVAIAAALGGRAPAITAAQNPQNADDIRPLLQRIERIAQTGDPDRYLDLLSDSADREAAREFATAEITAGATRVVVRERDRGPLTGTLPGFGYRLSLEIFSEFGSRARSASWRVDVKRVNSAPAPGPAPSRSGSRDESDDAWRISDQERLTQIENLYRLSLNQAKQFDARDLRIAAEDLDLTMVDGSAFLVESDQGPTGLVLVGRGDVRFHPTPEIEKGQLKLFCGAEIFQARFDATYLRVRPDDLGAIVDLDRLKSRAVETREVRRADEIFREDVSKSFAVDMSDMSRELWSINPAGGDFLAEIHTAKYDTLTYTRSTSEPEDISFFDRRRHRNIAVYQSAQARARFGRSYNEDDLAAYDVLGYNLEVTVTPDRLWIEGRAQLQIRVLATSIRSITFRLAPTLAIQSIFSDQFGRLLGLRVHNQNTVIVNLPAVVLRDDDLLLTVTYAGRLEPQREDTEAAAQGPARSQGDDLSAAAFQPERSFLYSARSYWYPQPPVTDYATASIRISLPGNYDCVASGALDDGFPTVTAGRDAAQTRKTYLFNTPQPVRYLAFVISRFVRLESVVVPLGDGGSLNLSVQTNPRQVRRGRELGERANDIIRFYDSLVGDAPYSAFTLAVLESELPGGHSPGFFAALNQPMPNTPFVWRNDPASFDDFPEFFIAHEIAHQWWGQAVGWRNYHEQWISEGFAQYFAALYAQHRRGDDTFAGMLRQFRRWGMQQSDQGPIFLGYRLGHIRGDSRVFRAVIYNKSAAVLHMLRRLLGDEPFFQGLRRFYIASRFKKAGTDDFREAMETAAGRSLERFFERWIYGSGLPRLKWSYRLEPHADGQQLLIHVDQIGELFDVPITIMLSYADKKDVQVVLPVTDRSADFPIALTAPLRSVDLSRDDGSLAEIVKN